MNKYDGLAQLMVDAINGVLEVYIIKVENTSVITLVVDEGFKSIHYVDVSHEGSLDVLRIISGGAAPTVTIIQADWNELEMLAIAHPKYTKGE